MEHRSVIKILQSLTSLGLLTFLAAPADAGHPIRVSISPTSSSVVAGQTRQFTAEVTNTSNPSVIWSATAGAISPTGLYTAPATVPSPATVTVTAKSVASPSASAS